MTSASALTLRSAGELAAAVPHLTGFVPEQSLVAISLRGKRRRVGLTLRADLDDSPALVELVVGAMCRDGAGACVLSVHTAQRAPSGLPRSDLVQRLRESLRDRGVPVLEALLVRGGRFWSYLDAGGAARKRARPSRRRARHSTGSPPGRRSPDGRSCRPGRPWWPACNRAPRSVRRWPGAGRRRPAGRCSSGCPTRPS